MSNDPFSIYSSEKSSSVRKMRRNIAVHEVDEFPADCGESVSTLKKPFDQFSLKWVLISAFILFTIIIVRVGYLQLLEGSDYVLRSDENRTQRKVTKAARGLIYTSDGALIAQNMPDFSLEITVKDIPRADKDVYEEYIAEIQEITGLADEQFQEIFDTSYETGMPITAVERIPYETALELLIKVQQIPGVDIRTDYQREYMGGNAYSHIIGYTGKLTAEEYDIVREKGYLLNDSIGKTGVELSYEEELRGDDGIAEIEIDYRGREKGVISSSEPLSGMNMHLAIDNRLQSLLYDKIAEEVDSKNLPGAAAVAIDPRDGSVRALVSYPSYNNNDFIGGISTEKYQQIAEDERNPLFHRAISGTYPSGSTFKPIVAAAGLEEGEITPFTTVHSTGGLQIDIYNYPDWKAGGHGITNVSKAIAESVNTFFYLLGGGDNENSTGLGVERIVEYGKKFGLTEKTGIDLPNEASGFLPSKEWKEEFKNEPWYIGDTYILSIGQGDILVTPLQVAHFTATIANGGTIYSPHIVQYFTNQTGEVIQTVQPEIQNEQVLSDETMQTVRNAMRETVLSGSARSLLTLPVTSAGKTGTAQYGAEDKTHSWFTVFAPYENPELSIAIIVQDGGGSNDAAVPIMREVLQEYYSN